MAILFYDHLIAWDKLDQALDRLALDKPTRLEYWEHLEAVFHPEILLVIITHLPAEKHEEFLERFHAAPHDPEHLHYLANHGRGDVELAIKARADALIDELLSELEM